MRLIGAVGMRNYVSVTVAFAMAVGLVVPEQVFGQAAAPAPAANNAPAAPAAPSPAPSTTTSDSVSQSADVSSGGAPVIIRTDLNWLITNRISKDFGATVDECSRYEEVYRIDCLRQNMRRIADSLPDDGDYRQVKRILGTAADRLGGILERYADPKAPRLRAPAGANPRFKQNRSYRAVRKDKVKQALAEATAVVQEAATQLLRSSENSAARLAHYQSISVAVGSTKVLLRSL
jgi:hypothetical protein